MKHKLYEFLKPWHSHLSVLTDLLPLWCPDTPEYFPHTLLLTAIRDDRHASWILLLYVSADTCNNELTSLMVSRHTWTLLSWIRAWEKQARDMEQSIFSSSSFVSLSKVQIYKPIENNQNTCI